MPTPVCDFCGRSDPTERLPARNSVLVGLSGNALAHCTGEWLACPECAALARAEEREELLVRAAEHLTAQAEELAQAPRRVLYTVIRQAHDVFFATRQEETACR